MFAGNCDSLGKRGLCPKEGNRAMKMAEEFVARFPKLCDFDRELAKNFFRIK